jgi:phage shock protein PspC (stress-responsive transcriptional regulator)
MTTVGYGNIVATTPYGRVSVILAILFGAFLLSLLVGLIINWFSLPSNQEEAINNIEL